MNFRAARTLSFLAITAAVLLAACSPPPTDGVPPGEVPAAAVKKDTTPKKGPRRQNPVPTTTTVPVTPTTSAPSTTTTTTSAPTTTVAPGGWWKPKAGATWQWQLDETIDTSFDVEVYDVDLFDTPASTVAELKAKGRKVICYFTVGSWETYRPDVASIPEQVKGKVIDGWPEERWLDIRRLDILAPYMQARLDLCKAKGFDGVEGDWMDNQTQDTGFPITAAHQLTYTRWLIDQAHRRGLAMGIKNDLDHAEILAKEADYSINEQCAEFDECHELLPWIRAGKPVFHTEYNLTLEQFCPTTTPMGFSSLLKRVELDAWRRPC
jgi:hypothetical protein